MTCTKLLVFLYVLRVSTSDWVSEWMAPIHDQLFGDIPDKARRSNDGNLRLYEDEAILDSTEKASLKLQSDAKSHTLSGLKLKLESTLENAKTLADALKNQISELSLKEILLKEAITHGKNGVSIITVSTLGQTPRKYIIREGLWTRCTGVIQAPMTNNIACYGQEMPTDPDHCVFNSVIKYETIPTRRRLQYIEEDYLCLKSNFNATLEQYMSVPKQLINDTCTNGLIRSLDENFVECGIRVLSEYTYYPNRVYPDPDLPLEYCTEPDGACKLLVAWHVSNTTIENFEFLKNEPSFKKYFIKDSQNI